MKIIFMGTPEAAAPFLDVCAKRHSVVGVVTQPDRPSGRGLRLRPSPVKSAAEGLGLPVLQPERPGLIADRLRAMNADMAVVVAYGKILKPDVLASTRLGFLNAHFSLLPKYRGAAPMQWSLIRGETRTGVTLFWIDEGMDTGAVQAVRETEIGPDEDALDLGRKLSALGAELLSENLDAIGAGHVRREPQTGRPSLAPRLTRRDALVGFDMGAAELHNRVRGLRAGPKAFVKLAGGDVALLKTAVESVVSYPAHGAERGYALDAAGKVVLPAHALASPPGTLMRVESARGILIQCLTGGLWIKDVQPEGKRQISAVDFVNGLRLKPGDRLVSNGK